jgi:hypothetical protein
MSVRVISELCEMLLGCERDVSAGRMREERVRYADDREESVTLVVEGTVECSWDGV